MDDKTRRTLLDICDPLVQIRIYSLKIFLSEEDTKDIIMGWKPIHFGLAGMMLIFGSFNTLSVKWADTMKR